MGTNVLDLQQILSSILAGLAEIASTDSRYADDYRQALREFFPSTTPDRQGLGRFHEWFLFERRSERFGDGPAYLVLSEQAKEALSREAGDFLDEFAGNRFSVYEVVEGEEKLTFRDLMEGGLFRIDDENGAELEATIPPDSLVVARLYPAGNATYVPSPFAFVVIDPVARALRQDLSRESHRGRLSQYFMEGLLFGAAEGAGGPQAELHASAKAAPPAGLLDSIIPPEPVELLEVELEQWLREAAIDGLDLDEVRLRFEDAESISEAVNSILEEVAFETSADLEKGRRILPAYFVALQQSRKGSGKPAAPPRQPVTDELALKAQRPCGCGSGELYGNCCLPKDAVARFDAGRARGEELNLLFADLAAAMGVDVEEDESDGMTEFAPDPPMAPMVMEYLWEREQTGLPAETTQKDSLQLLAASIDGGDGAPDDVSAVVPEHLLRFLACESYLQPREPSASEIQGNVQAIESFANWLESEQSVDWAPHLAAIRASGVLSSADRLARANGLLGGGDVKSWNRGFSITGLAKFGGQFELVIEPLDQSAVRGRLQVPGALGENLQIGDCLLVASDPEVGGSLPARLLRVLPAAAKPYLHSTSKPETPESH